MTDAEAATRKKRARAGHRGTVTRLCNETIAEVHKDPIDTDQLLINKRLLNEKLEVLRVLDGELADMLPEDDLEEEILTVDEYKQKIYRALAQIEKATTPKPDPPPTPPRTAPDPPPPDTVRDPPPTPPATAHDPPPTPPRTAPDPPPPDTVRDPPPTPPGTVHDPLTPPADPVATSTVRTATLPVAGMDRVKLPKIALPHFNGNLMRWTSFWDSFESAVHLNDRLAEVDKFNYLRSLLEGTAYDSIAGLSMTAVNYKEAIGILKKRFGNQQLIISRHMEALLNTEAVTSDNHLRDLRCLYDKSESNIRSLKALGVKSDSYGAMLSSVLLNKLPPDLRLIVSRKVSADDLDMDKLLETFELELSARERASCSNESRVTNRGCQQGCSSTSAFVTSVNDPPKCAFCQQNHPSTDCRVVLNIDDRKKILRDNGRCYNCLRKSHISCHCRSASKCRHCQGRHHSTICDKNITPAKPNPTSLNPKAPPYAPDTTNPTTSTFCSGATKRKSILLQTALTVAHNPARPKFSTQLRLLFDRGSQRSYLTERAMALLQLEPTGSQALSIATFGAEEEQDRVCPIVSVSICLREQSTMTLSLYLQTYSLSIS